MKKHHVETLISAQDVQSRIAEVAKEISHHYHHSNCENLVVIGLLRGSFMFMADLVRLIDLPLEVDFITASSYGSGTESSRDVRILKDLDGDIGGKDVLIVEDIIDTGLTLEHVIIYFKESKGVKTLKTCTLLSKPERRKVNIDIDYVGFDVPDKFVIGYGLDYDQKYRNLPYIAVVVFE